MNKLIMKTLIYIPHELENCVDCPKSKKDKLKNLLGFDWKCTITGNIVLFDVLVVSDFEGKTVPNDCPYRRGIIYDE